VLLLIPAAVLFIEVAAAVGLPSRIRPSLKPTLRRPRVAVLVPAHNEELVIDACLKSIFEQKDAIDRLIVVADNCSDKTALVAGAAGAEVITRYDTERRGKGYALDFGIRHLRTNPPDIVVIIDADCRIEAGGITRLTQYCAEIERPVQALYLMSAPSNAGVKQRIAEFAWRVKNLVRPLGLRKLGLPCQLMGTGMAFPWECMSRADLATGHIVEDLQLGIDLALAGTAPQFLPDAVFTSEFASSKEGFSAQRTRWEHGHLSLILGAVPRLLFRSIVSRDIDLLALALDLSVPPLALLTMMAGVLWLLTLPYYFLAADYTPLILVSIACGMLAFSVFASWFRFGRTTISFRDLCFTVLYSVGKIPLYLRFLYARQFDWVRSKRNGETDSKS
jgi:cellulose synthase/poly-beta-1,6-N-acetylglucosamine synthase-like glycosyltransferase